MTMAGDDQLQKPVPGDLPPQTSKDSQPTAQDEQIQIPVPDEPPSQPNNGSDSRSGISCIILVAVCLIISAGITVLVIWLSNRFAFKVYVESATLTTFNFSSSNILHHNLSVELSFRNPSSFDSATFKKVETSAYYGGKWFQWAPVDNFRMGHKSTTILRAVMAGATPLELGASKMELYSQQRKAGAFDLEVRLQMRRKYRFGDTKDTRRWYLYKCWLPGLRLGGTVGFVRTKCKLW